MMGTYQVDQVGHPLRGVYAHVVLVDCNTKLFKRLFALLLNLLHALHLLLPRLVETLHEFFAGFQLVLKFGFGDSLDGTILSLICDFLLRSRNLGIENGLSC